MKPIYISRSPQTKGRSWILVLFLIMVFVLVAARIAAPIAIRNAINKSGADERGYAYKVGDVDLSVFKGQLRFDDLKVFHQKTNVNFAEATNVVLDLDISSMFYHDKVASMRAETINVMLSKDFIEEMNRIKNEAKNDAKKELYFDQFTAHVETLNVRQFQDEKFQTVVTLKEADMTLKDLGVGSVNENTEFSLNSKLAEGGGIDLSGKTRLEKEETPWVIEGKMTNIPSAVIEKMAGDKIPLDIEEANINAAITAHSEGGKIEGEIVPDVKKFKFSENKEEGVIKRNVAKVSNFLFNQVKKDEDLTLRLPFTLNQNFTVNIPDTLKKMVE